jgi:hypothetical protein
MLKMGSHDPFGDLKHKLWPKERPKVKLAVWFPTIKIQELTWFPYVQVACDIVLESSQWRLQLCFRLHPNQRLAQKSYGAPKSWESQLWQFRDSHLRILGQKTIWMWASWRGVKYIVRGKVVASPKSGPWWVLWVWVCSWLVLATKMFSQGTNQLVVWFGACSCEWVKTYHSS